MSHAFDNRASLLEGKVQIYQKWNRSQAIAMLGPEGDDLRTIPLITNFVGGKGNALPAGPIVVNPTTDTARGSIFYIGAMKQQQQELCFPFDHVEAMFDLAILRPNSDKVQFTLFCECDADCGDECKAYDNNGNKVGDGQPAAKIVRTDTIGAAVGFDWDVFTCEVQPGKFWLRCSVTGIRDPELIFMSDIVPGIVIIGVGFASVWMPLKLPAMSMPRVSTAMIALLQFFAKGTAVMQKAPKSGGLSWLAHFFVAGVFVMMIIVAGHIYAFKTGKEHKVLKILNRYFIFFGYILFIFIDLEARSCAHVSGAISSFGLTFFLLAVLFTCSLTSYLHRAEIRSILNKSPQKKDDDLAVDPPPAATVSDKVAPGPPPDLPPPDAPPPPVLQKAVNVEQLVKEHQSEVAAESAMDASEDEIRCSDIEAQLRDTEGELAECRSQYESECAALAAQLQETEARHADAQARYTDAETQLAQQPEQVAPDVKDFEIQLATLQQQVKEAEARAADADVCGLIGDLGRWQEPAEQDQDAGIIHFV